MGEATRSPLRNPLPFHWQFGIMEFAFLWNVVMDALLKGITMDI